MEWTLQGRIAVKIQSKYILKFSKKKKNNNSIVFYEAKMPATLINKSIIRSKEVSEGIWTWGFKF